MVTTLIGRYSVTVSLWELFVSTGNTSRTDSKLDEAISLCDWARGITDRGIISFAHNKSDADLIKLSKVCDVLMMERGISKGGGNVQ